MEVSVGVGLFTLTIVLLADILSPGLEARIWGGLLLSAALAASGAHLHARLVWACVPILLMTLLVVSAPSDASSTGSLVGAVAGVGLVVGARRLDGIARSESECARALEELAIGVALLAIVHAESPHAHEALNLVAVIAASSVLCASLLQDVVDLRALWQAYRGHHRSLELAPSDDHSYRLLRHPERKRDVKDAYRRAAAPVLVGLVPKVARESFQDLASRFLTALVALLALNASIWLTGNL